MSRYAEARHSPVPFIITAALAFVLTHHLLQLDAISAWISLVTSLGLMAAVVGGWLLVSRLKKEPFFFYGTQKAATVVALGSVVAATRHGDSLLVGLGLGLLLTVCLASLSVIGDLGCITAALFAISFSKAAALFRSLALRASARNRAIRDLHTLGCDNEEAFTRLLRARINTIVSFFAPRASLWPRTLSESASDGHEVPTVPSEVSAPPITFGVTSGTGPLAYIATIRKDRVVLDLPQAVSLERRSRDGDTHAESILMAVLGAHVIKWHLRNWYSSTSAQAASLDRELLLYRRPARLVDRRCLLERLLYKAEA